MKHIRLCLFVALAVLAAIPSAPAADEAVRLNGNRRLPVKELTVFKDGHAFIAREGVMPTDSYGNVLLDELPAPVVGTFWPYAADARARLVGTVASRQRVLMDHTALNLRELIDANLGAEAIITEDFTNHYAATLLRQPTRGVEELEAASPPKKGGRMVLPVTETTLPYQDVFTLELPFGPPPEARGNLNSDQQRELARLFAAEKVMHKIRLTNRSSFPLTTAPALILHDGRVLAHGLMTYTAPGVRSDLALTTAVDIQSKKTDIDTKRTANALRHDSNTYSRVELAGTIALQNHRAQPVELEITRYIQGKVNSVSHGGKFEKLDTFEEGDATVTQPYWWNWYGWPGWWNSLNGISRITWKLTLPPAGLTELNYEWNYYWP